MNLWLPEGRVVGKDRLRVGDARLRAGNWHVDTVMFKIDDQLVPTM